MIPILVVLSKIEKAKKLNECLYSTQVQNNSNVALCPSLTATS
jgi:hypothetical protein